MRARRASQKCLSAATFVRRRPRSYRSDGEITDQFSQIGAGVKRSRTVSDAPSRAVTGASTTGCRAIERATNLYLPRCRFKNLAMPLSSVRIEALETPPSVLALSARIVISVYGTGVRGFSVARTSNTRLPRVPGEILEPRRRSILLRQASSQPIGAGRRVQPEANTALSPNSRIPFMVLSAANALVQLQVRGFSQR